MNNLKKIQNTFQNYLFQQNSSKEAVISCEEILNNDLHSLIISTNKISAEERLAVYSYAYQAHLIDALSEHYPMLKLYLGDEQFEALSLSYIKKHPSTYRSIRWFGDQLSSFLAENTFYRTFPYLSELAQFEWTQSLVFDALNSQILTLEEISTVPLEQWATMQFTSHPSVYRLNLSWNIVEIWQALKENQTPPEPTSQSTLLVLWRNNFINQYCVLTDDEAWAMDAMLNCASFSEICEGLCQWHDVETTALHAASLLKGWILSGLIAELSFPKFSIYI
jgi:hypothetical protein